MQFETSTKDVFVSQQCVCCTISHFAHRLRFGYILIPGNLPVCQYVVCVEVCVRFNDIDGDMRLHISKWHNQRATNTEADEPEHRLGHSLSMPHTLTNCCTRKQAYCIHPSLCYTFICIYLLFVKRYFMDGPYLAQIPGFAFRQSPKSLTTANNKLKESERKSQQQKCLAGEEESRGGKKT